MSAAPAAATPRLQAQRQVKGSFQRYERTLDLSAEPAVELTIEAVSLDTKNKWRDKHLCSPDFFDGDNHPQVHFVSESATLDIDATVQRDGDELEVETTTEVDQRRLGMTWSPLSSTTTMPTGRSARRPTKRAS